MSRLPWVRYEGGDVEAVVSMFVCREHPHAFRVRPSRGDGGIDVCVPISPTHVEIYQVKNFAENLSSSQKGQIVESCNKIKEYATTRGWTIDRWHLTLPLDPTPENTEWFEELEKTAGFPCTWKGLATVDGWAAAYPDIVDYYLRDGRDRLAEEIARFTAVSAISMSSSTAPAPADFASLEPSLVQRQLATLRDTLNRRDPHYLYDFAVSNQPAPPPPGIGDYPALVASTSRGIGDSYVTFHVLARGAESAAERPIRFSGTLTAIVGSDEQRELDEFNLYGRAPTIPLDITNLSTDLPGGLGGEIKVGKIFILDPEGDETFERRLAVLSPTNEILAEVTLTMSRPTVNHDGTGSFNRGTDAAGFLTMEILTDVGSTMTLRLHLGELSGHYPDKIEQSLALAHYFDWPNKMRISATRGPTQAIQEIPLKSEGDGANMKYDLPLRYVRALMVIQRLVTAELKIPDLATEDATHINEVLQAARLIDGQIVDVHWERLNVTLRPDVEPPEGLQQMVFQQELEVTVGGNHFGLGRVLVEAAPVKVDNVRTIETGSTTVDFIPALGKDIAHLRWLGADSMNASPPAANQQGRG